QWQRSLMTNKSDSEEPFIERRIEAIAPQGGSAEMTDPNRIEDLSSRYSEDFYKWMADKSQRSAAEVLPYVFDLCKPRSVCDIGCGTGAWLAVAKGLGISDVLGFDGPHISPESLLIAPSEFVGHDLEQPLVTPRRFDLAISLEVGEHLDSTYANTLVASLVAAAPVVLFSAA